MNAYSFLAKEINSDFKNTSNVVDIGEIKSLDPMSISLSDILLDEEDIILTDKVQKLIEPLIPDIECNVSYTGECSCSCEAKIKEDKYEEDKLKVGDKVVLNQYAGTTVKIDGEELVIVKYNDILAIVE